MVGDRYYSDKLSAARLERVYEIASPRVRQYLKAELEYVMSSIGPSDTVLELGCGYGRVLARLAEKAKAAVGIDTSLASLALAKELYQDKVLLAQMDAVNLGFADASFDLTACVQNGVSAFKVDKKALMRESLRVTRPGGFALFSSYATAFWDHRLDWFVRQAEEGLLGEIDWEATGGGVIVCKDGFRATTISGDEFQNLALELDRSAEILEVDGSSLFCCIEV
jgi:ubiquinone/menaquinone biosynthesis C-methylase UbiE